MWRLWLRPLWYIATEKYGFLGLIKISRKLLSTCGHTIRPNMSPAPFYLTGFPGLEEAHYWISIFIFAVCISMLGNDTLLYLIKDDHNLHGSMHYFLAMLVDTDLMVILTTIPALMDILWVTHWEISREACFLWAYLIHSLSIVESGILPAMAYNHFSAICNPLQYIYFYSHKYSSGKVRNWSFMWDFISITSVILHLFSFSYCHSYVVSHAFCHHQEVMKLACADIIFNRLYPVILIFLTIFLNSLIIFFPYILILNTVRDIASGEKKKAKALNIWSPILVVSSFSMSLWSVCHSSTGLEEMCHRWSTF